MGGAEPARRTSKLGRPNALLHVVVLDRAGRVVDEIRGLGHLVARQAHTVQLGDGSCSQICRPMDLNLLIASASFVARSRARAFSAVKTLARSAS